MAEGHLTIRQIAALAEVSKSTAALALQNSPKLSAKTRRKVQAVARKHGYVPDPLTSTLMSHLRIARRSRRNEKLAYLTWWHTPDQWRQPGNESRWFEGARARAESLGYDLEPLWAREPGMSAARLNKVLYTRSIRGAIVAPLPEPKGRLELDLNHLAVAAIGYTVEKPAVHRASHAHPAGMLLSLEQLARLGYKRPGFANLKNQVKRVSYGWLGGYVLHQQSLPLARRLSPLLTREWDRDEFVRWLETNRPDVVISNNSAPAQFMTELGYDIPDDIGFVLLDVQPEDACAGIDQRPPLVGSAAVDLVVAQLLKNEFGAPDPAKTVSIEGVWRDGPTVRKLGSTAGKRIR
jgi:LacI family transcriptional regulator